MNNSYLEQWVSSQRKRKFYENLPMNKVLSRRSFFLDDVRNLLDKDIEAITYEMEMFSRSRIPKKNEEGFYSINGEECLYNKEEIARRIYWNNMGHKFYIPFECVSYEFITPIHFRTDLDTDMYHFLGGVIIHEQSPFVFNVGVLTFQSDDPTVFHFDTYKYTDVWAMMEEIPYLDVFFRRMTDKKFVFGKSKRKVKTKINDRKFINEIVYVSHKKHIGSFEKKINSGVDWSHKWEVRGHWRKCRGIGKDREGNKKIFGYCWVKDHVKGKGNLVIKKRVSLL